MLLALEIPLAVTVRAPRGTTLRLRAGAARLRVEGRADEVSVHGTGEIRLDEVAGRTELRCGTGEVRIGRLDFEEPDAARFPALGLARAALVAGGGGVPRC